ncbi:hypothetical protein TRAPUB_4656 [Trametes pubescens]|uniref:Uncharacterized protein n=1 Tax=Trametes pubescens TaxID=154538 RepID=A0A1M2VAQ7_TRAPU|nr:hypothetical protein TRAPUB_4656 [Trametes pubescens]
MSPTQSTDGYIRTLSHAVFSCMDPGRPVLKLLDPATNELCDFRLVKIPRRTTTSPAPARPIQDQSSGKLGGYPTEASGSVTPGLGFVAQSSHTTGGSLDCASELWHGPPSFGARFNSPLARLPPLSVRSRGDGTPSLFNDSRNSGGSSPSLGPTPIRQLFPGVARARLDTSVESPWATGSAAFAGLGFSELHKDDGTPFDGLGSLPRHTSTPQYGRASPTFADDSAQSNPIHYLNLVRPRTTATPAAGGILSPPLAPARHSGGGRARSVAGTLPVGPDDDDVFLSRPIRVPGSLARGLFQRSSSACGTKGVRRASGASAPGATRRTSWGWLAGDAEADSTRDGGERRPVWKP